MVNGKPDFVYAGMNYRMTDFQAVLGLFQLSEIENLIDRRIKIAKEYDEKLSVLGCIKTPKILKNRKTVYQTYHIIIDDTIDRDVLINSLRKKGIETNIGAHALNDLTYYKCKYNLTCFPNAIKAFRQGLALPIGNHITKEELEYITEKFIELNGKNYSENF